MTGRKHTEILGWLAGDGYLLHERPLAVVLDRLVVALVDVVGDSRLGEPLAQVPGKGLPVGMVLFAAFQEELDLHAELE